MEDIIYQYEIIDYTEQLEFITEKIETLNENLIIFNNDLVSIVEIFIIVFGFYIGYKITTNFIKVMFNG